MKQTSHQTKDSKTLELKEEFKEPKNHNQFLFFNLMDLKQWKVNENEELDFLSYMSREIKILNYWRRWHKNSFLLCCQNVVKKFKCAPSTKYFGFKAMIVKVSKKKLPSEISKNNSLYSINPKQCTTSTMTLSMFPMPN